MTGKIFSIQESGDLLEMNEVGFVTEDAFQRMLERYPDLLAGDQIQSDAPRRWLLIKREMGVAGEPKGSDRWSLDHLFIDQDGIPTLVEVKRSSDTRIRREVVGQMLDYAANAVVHWSLEKIQSEFERQCEKDNANPDEELASFLDTDTDSDSGINVDEFWQTVKTNLQASKVRLLFVADEIPIELRRIVEFLNSQMDPAEILAVEIRRFVGQGNRTLVPRVIGQTAEAQARKKTKPGSRGLTKFTVTVNGVTYTNQAKRRAVLRIVQALVNAGVSPARIEKEIDWRQIFYEIPTLSEGESLLDGLIDKYDKPRNTWFLKADELVQYEGTTYAMGKQWGERTEEALEKLTKAFSDISVSYKVEK